MSLTGCRKKRELVLVANYNIFLFLSTLQYVRATYFWGKKVV